MEFQRPVARRDWPRALGWKHSRESKKSRVIDGPIPI